MTTMGNPEVNLPGVTFPYQEPKNPDLVVSTEAHDHKFWADKVIGSLDGLANVTTS